MLYHASPEAGLIRLEPHTSTHGVPYVYAVNDRITALLFGAKQDDFDFCISTHETGIPLVWECYPGALEIRYQGQGCSLYRVAREGFLSGQTGWNAELVCPRPVPVLQETRIPDLLQALLAAEADGSLILRRFSEDPEYKKRIAAHVVDRFVRFSLFDKPWDWEKDDRFSGPLRPLAEGFLSLTDGHLL